MKRSQKDKALRTELMDLFDAHGVPELKIEIGGGLAAGTAELDICTGLGAGGEGKVKSFSFDQVFRHWLKHALEQEHGYEDECCEALIFELEAALKWLKPRAAKARRRTERAA